MTVLYVLDYGTVGGATRSFVEMVTQMKSLGVHPIVVTSKRNELNDELEAKGIKTVAAGHYTLFEPFFFWKGRGWPYRLVKIFFRYHVAEKKAIKYLKKEIDFQEVDIIHTNSARNSIGCRLSLEFNIPHVVHIREFGDKDFNCIRLSPFKNLYNNGTTKFICISQAVKEHWITKGLDKKKMTVVYNGINYQDISRSLDDSKRGSKLRLVIVGGIIPAKGQHIAVDAVCNLPYEIRNNIYLDIIGWGEEKYIKQLKQKISAASMMNNIRFLGARSDVHTILGDYQIGLMCSRSEGFGRTTAEYMHAQLGVIASDSGANKELITGNVEGLLFDSGDSTSLSNAILTLYNDRELLIKYSHAAYEKARSSFTSEMNAANVHAIYKNLTKD